MTRQYEVIFQELSNFWADLRNFCYGNRSIIELFFIALYTLEQVLLVYLVTYTKNQETLVFRVSLFAIAVLTTFAIHKLIMESRIKILEKDLIGAYFDKTILEKKTREIVKSYRQLENKHRKLLNYISQDNSKDLNNKKVTLNSERGVR